MEAGTSDRGACLLIVAQLENELEAAIVSAMPKMALDVRSEMFERDGPMATFARKISMAAAMGIIGPKSRSNLKIIRHVRNAFAHAKIPIDFETDEVARAYEELQQVDPTAPHSTLEHINVFEGARPLFMDICASTMLMLYSFTGAKVTVPKGVSKLVSLAPKSPLP